MGINPNGVVPTLVDNGVVIIESADIIDYLDKKFLPNSLRPELEQDKKQMYEWIRLATDNHLSIKTYMYNNLNVAEKNMKRTPEQMKEYRKNQRFNAALLDFHERFNSKQGFTKEALDNATTVIDNCFIKMNERLANNEWLAGSNFTLADVTWIPQLVVLKAANYPFKNYPNLEKWKNTIIQRPSFKQAVITWLPKII